MAGKSAAVHGLVHDATPFRFSEENTAIEYHGKLLEEGKLGHIEPHQFSTQHIKHTD